MSSRRKQNVSYNLLQNRSTASELEVLDSSKKTALKTFQAEEILGEKKVASIYT